MQQSKYEPLHGFLASRRTSEFPMSFDEVERVLGFPLPPSARRHPAWWSNNRGTNVAVRAWRDAGWRTSRVDVPGQRVTFVREQTAPLPKSEIRMDGVLVNLDDLTGAGRKHLADIQQRFGLDEGDAVRTILDIAGRRALMDWCAANSPQTTSDSVEILREARDER